MQNKNEKVGIFVFNQVLGKIESYDRSHIAYLDRLDGYLHFLY